MRRRCLLVSFLNSEFHVCSWLTIGRQYRESGILSHVQWLMALGSVGLSSSIVYIEMTGSPPMGRVGYEVIEFTYCLLV